MRKEERNFTPDEAVIFGAQLDDMGKLDEAEGVFRAVLKIDGEHFNALQRLGTVLAKKQSYYEALYRFDRALRINRRSALVYGNRGMVLSQLGHEQEACQEFEKSLAIKSGNPLVWSNYGNVLERLGRYSEALSALNRSLALDPTGGVTYFNRGIVLARLNKPADAVADFKRAVAIDPDHAEAHFNLSVSSLMIGDYELGFREYEWRWKTADYAQYRDAFPRRKWLGEDVVGKNVMVYGDQGYGDALMFARYIPMLRDRGANIFLSPHAGMHKLWKANFPYATVFDGGESLEHIDYGCPLPSLPLAFGTTLDTVPPPLAYIGHEDRVPHWRDWFGRDDARRRIGICWSGNWQHKNDENRSIALETFRQLFDQVDLRASRLVSLQYDIREMDKQFFDGAMVERPKLTDWFDSAAVASLLDVVVTVDTSVAHLTGSLGVPTSVLLPTIGGDWRWGLSGETTPWYPSMRLYRQSRAGNWGDVLARVGSDLRAKQTAQAA